MKKIEKINDMFDLLILENMLKKSYKNNKCLDKKILNLLRVLKEKTKKFNKIFENAIEII